MKYFVTRVPLANAINSIMAMSGADCYVDGRFRENRPFYQIESAKFEKAVMKEQKIQDVEIYLPSFNELDYFEIGIAKDAVIQSPRPYTIAEPIVFYGSSITHGATASRPGINYVARVARALDADFINLGFAGSAKGQLLMAEYISTLKMSAFVLDYDANSGFEELSERHMPFYETVRKPLFPLQ